MAKTFSELWSELKSVASADVAAMKAKMVAFEQNIVPVIEADIVAILDQFKGLAVQTVLNLARAEFDNLSGREKQSVVVTHVFMAAEAAGKALAVQDAQMLAQQAYNAVGTALAPAP